MTPLQTALVRAVLFLLRRYAVTGWVPDGEPMHNPHVRPWECPCSACQLAEDLKREAS